MLLSEFIKFYPLRSPKISWLFGAGSSVSAGLPSAYDLIWDFKRRIYCAEQGYQLNIFENLTDQGLRNQIQSYFDSQEQCPALDSVEEYSYYFERAYASKQDRKEYIRLQMEGLNPTYGHKVIGVLMKHKLLNLIFTTNFDKGFENTAIDQFKNMDSWFSATIDNAETGLSVFQSDKRPLIVKLHGDYLSDKLKNISSELQSQDKKLRDIFSISLMTNGLAVMGYSGRDLSIMEVLFDALNQESSFPYGIFWFTKAGNEPLPIVTEFIQKAVAMGKDAHIIEIDTFDTAWGEIIKGFDKLPKEDLDKLNQNYFRTSNLPLPSKGTRFPVIRLNAIKIEQYPATARLYKCEAGNTKEIKELISAAKSNIVAIRKKSGIVGFGEDEEFVKVFSQYGNHELDIYQIPDKDLVYDDSTIKGLITEALQKSLVNDHPLMAVRRRERYLIIPNPKQVDSPAFSELKKELDGTIKGKIPGSNLEWIVSLEISIQSKLSTPLLLLKPGILASKTMDENERHKIAPFIKEKTARWYNEKFDRLFNSWLNILFGNENSLQIQMAKELNSGVNARFKISRTSARTRLI